MSTDQIKTVKFRYNRFNGTLGLVLLLGFFWIVGIFLNSAFLNLLGLQSGTDAIPTGKLPAFWQSRPALTLAVSFLPFLLWMIVAVWLACFSWRFLIDAKARAEIYDGYALLYLGSKIIRIENSTDIVHALHGKSVAYEIRNKDKIYYLTESLQELYEKKYAKDKDDPRIPSSLNEAMEEIICAVY